VYETPDTRNGLANDIRYTGGFHNSEDFGKKLYVLALRRGLRTAGLVIFIGDGAKWIWKLASYHFPEAIQIVDFYHASERLWSLSREGTKACKDWARKRIKHFLKGKAELVISSLSELCSSNADVTKEIEDNITYFTNNKERMRYNEYRKHGYQHRKWSCRECLQACCWSTPQASWYEMVSCGCRRHSSASHPLEERRVELVLE
jgi:hypothetical protein